MLETTDPWLEFLQSKIGIHEVPPGSNRTPIGKAFGWDGVAWCAETQSLALEAAFGRRILWTASVAQARQQAQAGLNGMTYLSPQARIQVGDLSLFDFGGNDNWNDFHISGVVNPGTQNTFKTIGGNEADAVVEQWRDRKYIMGFIRPPWKTVGYGLPNPTKGPQMKAILGKGSGDAVYLIQPYFASKYHIKNPEILQGFLYLDGQSSGILLQDQTIHTFGDAFLDNIPTTK